MITSPRRDRVPPGGGAIDKLAAGLAPRLEPAGDADLEKLDLPDVLLDWLRPPLEQLGYEIKRLWLEADATPRPLFYTVAKNDVIELTLIHLPPIFYSPTNIVAVAAKGIGFAFGPNPRLHLCSEQQDKLPPYLEKAMTGWNAFGVVATFHTWTELGRLAVENDRAALVVEILELDADHAALASRVIHLERGQFDVTSRSLLARFTRQDALRRLLREEFGKNLSAISSDKVDLEVNVEDVIEHAERNGWIRDLVRVALEKDPKNDGLRKVAAALGVSSNGDAPGDK
jgi:Effector-associated domain 1